MKKLIWMLAGLLCATAAAADTRSLYLAALAGIERQLPAAPGFAGERQRLDGLLGRFLAAYAALYPEAAAPHIRLVDQARDQGTAWSLDSGAILVNPRLSALLPDPVVSGLLAHELVHIAMEHGWIRTQTAYDTVAGPPGRRLALAMTGRHPLKGSPAWSALLHAQEYQADREGRRLLVRAGLPAAWLGEAIRGVADVWATGSHPSGEQRLVALDRPAPAGPGPGG